MNKIMVYPNQQAVFASCNLYTMEVDYENRNCYNCEEFGHLSRNCKNKEIGGRIGKSRKLKYRNGNNGQRRASERENRQNNNLNRNKNLIVLNQVLVITTDLQCSVE